MQVGDTVVKCHVIRAWLSSFLTRGECKDETEKIESREQYTKEILSGGGGIWNEPCRGLHFDGHGEDKLHPVYKELMARTKAQCMRLDSGWWENQESW